ncbi:MAG: hypothetical protein LBC40_00880 [Dysgonamonadaceae bacterium]|jgi:hypothetical protein|nr:hypothetical protein [Dysgonamonadaceae bacterium]
MVKVIVEPVYEPGGEKFEAMRKTIKILGLKVFEKTSKPLRVENGGYEFFI